MKISKLGVGATGNLTRNPFKRRFGSVSFSVISPPSFTGTLSNGSTLTAVSGTYAGPAWTHQYYTWYVYVGNTQTYTATGPTYTIPSTAAAGTIYVEQTFQDIHTQIRTERSLVQSYTSTATSPTFSTNPSVTASNTNVGGVITKTRATVSGVPTPTVTDVWYRNGVVLTGVSGLSYTIVSDDVGATITTKDKANNGVGGDFYSNASTGVVVTSPSNNVVNVANMSALQTALNSATAGTHYVLASGTHTGTVSISNKSWNPRITIRGSLTQGSEPVITSRVAITMDNCSGMNIEGLNFKPTARDPDYKQDGQDVGDPGARAINFKNCSNYKISNCYSEYAGKAFTLINSENYEVCYNTVVKCPQDHFVLYGKQKNFDIHHNVCRDTLIALGSPQKISNRHPDCFQFAVAETNEPATDGKIHHNYMQSLQFDGSDSNDLHGIFFYNEAVDQKGASVADKGHKRVEIVNNYMELPASQGGVLLTPCTDFTVNRNIMRQPPNTGTSGEEKPRLWFGATASNAVYTNVTISNNLAPFAIYRQPGSGVTYTNNNWDTNTGTPTGWEALNPDGSNKNVGQWGGAASTGVAPTFTTQPSISGTTAIDGSSLTVSYAASGTPTPTPTYQWYRAGTAISGATSSTYVKVAADAGNSLTAKVVISNASGQVEATTATGITPIASSSFPTKLTSAQWSATQLTTEARDRVQINLTSAGETARANAANNGYEMRVSITPDDVVSKTKYSTVMTSNTVTKFANSAVGDQVYVRLLWRRTADETTVGGTPAAWDQASANVIKVTMSYEGTGSTTPTLGAISSDSLTKAMSYGNAQFTGRSENKGTMYDNAYAGAYPMVYALALKMGNTTTEVKNKVDSQFTTFVTGGKCPPGIGGYYGQHESNAAAFFALIKNTSSYWSDVSNSNKTKADLIMKGLLVSAAFNTSDSKPSSLASTNMSDTDTTASLTANPNISFGCFSVLGCCIAYFGAATCKDILDTYNHSDFVTALNAESLSNMSSTFTWKADHSSSGAPSSTQITNTVKNWKHASYDITEYDEWLNVRIPTCYNRDADKGYRNGAGMNKATWETYTNVAYVSKGADGRATDGRGSMIDSSTYAPASGGKKFRELESVDAYGPRSSWAYACWTSRTLLNVIVVLVACGKVNKDTKFIDNEAVRINSAYIDLREKIKAGWESIANWAPPGKQQNGGDETVSNRKTNWGLEYTQNIWFDVLRPWFVDAGHLSAPDSLEGHWTVP